MSTSFRDRRYEIYLAYQANGQSQRATHRAIGVDPTTVIRWVREVEDEIARGAWTPPDGAATEATPAPFVAIADRVSGDRQARQTAAQLQDLRDRYGHALEQIAELERQNEAILAIRQPVEPITITADPGQPSGQAVAIVQASDWHVEERVEPSTVGWRNEYNPDIAQLRAEKYFQNVLKLIRAQRREVAIDRIILHLGGDLVSGYIHEELEESNYLSPVEAIQFVKRLFIGGLKLWKQDGEFKEIFVITNFGNHGRTTKKIRVSTGYKNSYEWMSYQDLASLFSDDEVIRFQSTNSYFNVARVFDRTLRFHHGDAVNYGGGIGGLTIPLLRYLAKSNHQQAADADFIGHFHQLMPHSRAHRFIVNGSLIGFNAYAQRIGASPEPPLQSFHLLDVEKGFTVSAPIFCAADKLAVSGRGGKGKR